MSRDSRPNSRGGIIPLALCLLALVPWASGAQPVSTETVIAAPAQLAAVTEQPAVLRIHGPGGYHSERALEAGAAIEFSGLDGQGDLLADGTYEWELRTFGPSGKEQVTSGIIVLAGGLRVTDSALILELDPEPEATDHTNGDKTIQEQLCVGGHCTLAFSPAAYNVAIAQAVTAGQSLSLNFRDVQSEACSGAARCWALHAKPNHFELDNGIQSGTELAVSTSGNVGIGTAIPATDLHIDPINSSSATVQLSGATSGGFPIAVDWRMRLSSTAGGDLVFEKKEVLGTFTSVMSLDPFAERVTVHGDFTAGSSRSIKRDFAPVSGAEVLAKLAELPVQTWSYKRDEQGARHLGVVAEDFHEAFGLGADAEHIAPLDTAGVAFAAIQELHGRLQMRERDIELLIAANEELRGELAALRRTLEKPE